MEPSFVGFGDKTRFFSEHYFSMHQLGSYAHQLNMIFNLKPDKILEVGIGGGFVSLILKRAGFDITTVDIDSSLQPDIVSSITGLPGKLTNTEFDLVTCCEVLEHLPFEEFEESVAVMRSYSPNLLITLPSYEVWYGISGFSEIPLFRRMFRVGVHIRRAKRMSQNHHWELGSSKATTRAEVAAKLGRFYSIVEHGVLNLNCNHEYFLCRDRRA